MLDAPKPAPPDPQVVAQQEAANAQRTTQIQSSLGDDTINLLRQFGQNNAMSYAGLSTSVPGLPQSVITQGPIPDSSPGGGS